MELRRAAQLGHAGGALDVVGGGGLEGGSAAEADGAASAD